MRPIDADALVDYLDDELLNECLMEDGISADDAVLMMLRKVFEAPTININPVIHARWEDGGKHGEQRILHCSNCLYCIQDSGGALLQTPRFCASCGAKMY